MISLPLREGEIMPFCLWIRIFILRGHDMKKTVLIILLFSLLLSACTRADFPDGAQISSDTAITFTDDLGRTVTVDQPRRIACLTASFADIWCLAGGSDTLVATTNSTWIYFDLPLSENVVNLGSSKSISLEQLIACQPDLILASCGSDRNLELENALEQANLTVAYFSVNNFEDYLRMLKTCTDITGNTANYNLYGTLVAQQVNDALSRPDGTRPSVLCMRVTGTGCKVKEY
jgi:iron complex transport system substrate-binding protein